MAQGTLRRLAKGVLNNVRRRVNHSRTASIAGRSFIVPWIGGLYLRPSEPWMSDLLRRLFALRRGGFVDVGVNMGQTLLKVAALDPDRPYLGFEPNPACCFYVSRLLKANGLRGYPVLPIGLGEDTLVADLVTRVGHDFDASATIIANFRDRERCETKFVPILALNDIPSRLFPADIGVIKIDVEGAEVLVMKTLRPLIATHRPLIVIEILPSDVPNGGDERLARQAELESLLAELDYRILRIVKAQNAALGLTELEAIGPVRDVGLSDYVLCSAEDVNALLGCFNSGPAAG